MPTREAAREARRHPVLLCCYLVLGAAMASAVGCAGARPAATGGSSVEQQAAAGSASARADQPGGERGDAGRDGDGAPATTTTSGASSSTSPAPTAAPGPPQLAFDSYPPGVDALNEAETKELKERCDGLLKHLRKVSANDSGSRARLERIHTILKSPPSLPGVDVPRCAKLLERSVVAYRAQTIESQGINGIKRIIVGLSMSMSAAKPRLCPSAPSTPAVLTALARGPLQSSPSQWQHEGWRCVRFERAGATAFQYQLRTDASDGSYEIIARGYPVDGQPPVELFLKGASNNDAIEMSSEVYRRGVTR